MEPRAPDHVRHVEDPIVFQQWRSVPNSYDSSDAFDPRGGDVLRPDPNQRGTAAMNFGRTFRPIGVLRVSTW